MNPNIFQRLAGRLARSPLLREGRRIWAENEKRWNLPLTKRQKLMAGLYIILADYEQGRFPPVYTDAAQTWAAEEQYRATLPGMDAANLFRTEMRKPFWMGAYYVEHFSALIHIFRRCDFMPPRKLLELGCGSGWMAEFLALGGYDVTATSLLQEDLDMAARRCASIQAKGLDLPLRFLRAPMENVDQAVSGFGPFDGVMIYEALHHAFDWRRTVAAAARCLRPGGKFFILHEPNRIHTFVSYRVARLSNTHEIGIPRGGLLRCLRENGFRRVHNLRNAMHFGVRPHWICAEKGD